jgi:hypothetical protein
MILLHGAVSRSENPDHQTKWVERSDVKLSLIQGSSNTLQANLPVFSIQCSQRGLLSRNQFQQGQDLKQHNHVQVRGSFFLFAGLASFCGSLVKG